MAKETPEKVDLFETIEKSGGKITIGFEGDVKATKVDLTKIRYLANFSKRSIIFGELGMTMMPGDIVDLKKFLPTDKQAADYRCIRDALVRETPLIWAYEDSEEGKELLLRDTKAYIPELSPLEKAKNELPPVSAEGITQPEEVVLGDKSSVNPFQEELEEQVRTTEEGIVLGASSSSKKKARKKID